jgi:hypothetical protein
LSAPQSDGERLLAAYLRQGRLPWEHEREVNGTKPDFSVDHPQLGHLLFEVYEPQIRLPPQAGFFDTIPNLQLASTGGIHYAPDGRIVMLEAVREPWGFLRGLPPIEEYLSFVLQA